MLDKPREAIAEGTTTSDTPVYMPGFGNDFETESLPGALPQGQNSPQRCNYGLYAEQLSGSPFTAPRGTNERSWLYRIRPSVRHTRRFSNAGYPFWKTAPCLDDHSLPLGQLRWDPLPAPTEPLNFLEGIRTMTAAGDALTDRNDEGPLSGGLRRFVREGGLEPPRPIRALAPQASASTYSATRASG